MMAVRKPLAHKPALRHAFTHIVHLPLSSRTIDLF